MKWAHYLSSLTKLTGQVTTYHFYATHYESLELNNVYVLLQKASHVVVHCDVSADAEHCLILEGTLSYTDAKYERLTTVTGPIEKIEELLFSSANLPLCM